MEWLNRFNTIPLNDNQRFALAYLRRNPLAPKLTNRDYQRINSVDSVQATKELGDMVKRAGVLVLNGTRGGAYYTLSEMVLEKQQTEFFPAPLLKDNENKVIDYIKKNGFITNSLCRELLGIGDKDAANYLLTNMFKKNLVKRTGRGKGTKYTL
mgnify:FL=1